MAETKAQHRTDWEDSGMVSVIWCGDQRTDRLILTDDGEPQRCDVCGKFVRLVWDVRIETVNSAVKT